MRNTKVLLTLVILFVAVPLSVQAQTVEGVITGTIFDASGAVVPKAAVTITNEGTNISETRTTGTDGAYLFPLVPPGTYTVTVVASGFKQHITRGIIVEASKTVPLNVTLGWV